MAKLVKPAQFAKETGISRQAVYAKIKRGTLKSKEIDDQIFIIIDDNNKTKARLSQIKNVDIDNNYDNVLKVDNSQGSVTHTKQTIIDVAALIDSKNETIEILKSRIKDLKESNQQLTSVFRSEIDLLKEAFVEMKRIYIGKLEYEKRSDEVLENNYIDNKADGSISWIGVKKFLKIFGYDNSHKSKVKDYLTFLYSAGDTRVAKIDGKIKINKKFCSEQIIKDALLD